MHPDSNVHHTNAHQSDLGEPSHSLRHLLVSHSQSCPSAHTPNHTDTWRYTTTQTYIQISSHVVTKIIATPREKTTTTQNHSYRHTIARNTITQTYNYTDEITKTFPHTATTTVTVARNHPHSQPPDNVVGTPTNRYIVRHNHTRRCKKHSARKSLQVTHTVAHGDTCFLGQTDRLGRDRPLKPASPPTPHSTH